MLNLDPKVLKSLDKTQLFDVLIKQTEFKKSILKKLIIEKDRVDLLSEVIIGRKVYQFHALLLQHQFKYKKTIQLAFRGAGKSSHATIAKIIHTLCKNPNARILLASKTISMAQTFLKEISDHLQQNKMLISLFGEFYDKHSEHWNDTEIVIKQRTIQCKEASITCVGVDTGLVGKHFDLIICDDLVDESNARTPLQREKLRKWFYSVLDPTLEPDGELHILGTRYHYDDLYGDLMDKNDDFKRGANIIPIIDSDRNLAWPERWPYELVEKKRIASGTIVFNAQYLCNTEAMKGEIFQYDWFQQISEDKIPALKHLKIFMGVDLAISQKESSDKFAIVVLGVHVVNNVVNYYVLDYFDGHLRFSEQTKKIMELQKKWNPIWTGIEANAYQDAQIQSIEDAYGRKRQFPSIKKIFTITDKMTRMQKLTPVFENLRVFFPENKFNSLIDQFVLFPSFRYKDGLDAFDIAYQTTKKQPASVRKERKKMI